MGLGTQTCRRLACAGLLASVATACDRTTPTSTDDRPAAAEKPRSDVTTYAVPGTRLSIDAWPNARVVHEDPDAVTVFPPEFEGVGDALTIEFGHEQSLKEQFELHAADLPPAGKVGKVEVDGARFDVRTIERTLAKDRFVLTSDIKLEGEWHPGMRMIGLIDDGKPFTCSASFSPAEFAEVGLRFCKTLRRDGRRPAFDDAKSGA